MIVHLSYYGYGGKWYADGHYDLESMLPLQDIWHDVERKLSERKLPGLAKGHSPFYVTVHVPDHQHNHPHLITPYEWRTE